MIINDGKKVRSYRKMRMTFADAQRNVSEIANRQTYGRDVIFELLAAYGRSASAITKLRGGSLNLAKDLENEVFQRGVVYFKHVKSGNLRAVIENLDQDPAVVRYNPRYLIATDYNQLVAKDTKKDTTLDIKLRDIDRNVDFFYGWTGDEITSEKTEAIADRRAAEKMKDLYAEIENINKAKLTDPTNTFRHDLNVFFSRLLFCFFAEDTKIFSKDEETIFTSSIKDFTQTDGSDLDEFLQTLFNSLDTPDNEKHEFTSPYSKFPYVNGTIFDTEKHNIAIPKFNAQARKLILDCGNQNWAEINPDIFGSMFQSIVDKEHRAENGMHYTSVPNIMKTIEPLFLDELREEFDKYYDDDKKLNLLWNRISNIKVFDPACGSGNFLIIAYKELRKIEHGIIERLFGDNHKRAMLLGKLESRIKLDNFYGIEIDDFAHEVAILSLYLAKHQMNIEFQKQFGREIKLIPLKDNAKIVHGNAIRLDWNKICPNDPHIIGLTKANNQETLLDLDDTQPELELSDKSWDEIYLISNPPYLGQRNQKQNHRDDMATVFSEADGKYKKLDYVASWFIKGAEYIKDSKAKLAFISTDSISQGVQVGQLWPRVLSNDIEIIYAYTSFKWINNAKDNAGVSVAVIGLSSATQANKRAKYIFKDGTKKAVENITPYLSDAEARILKKHNEPISQLPRMTGGNQPREGGYFMLSDEEKDLLVNQDNRINSYIKPMVGANELIKDIRRWCIWIEDDELAQSMDIPELRKRIELVRDKRQTGNSVEKAFANVPHKFVTTKRPEKTQIVLPSVSSESRRYIPIAVFDRNTIVTSSCFCIFDAGLDVFAILNSYTHNLWVKAVTGRLETRINYASNTCYNSFPIRPLLEHEKNELALKARNILLVRENHSEKTLAEMYDAGRMPEDLRVAHAELDLAIDQLYRPKPYNSDEERLIDLFELYEQMTASEKEKKA